MNAPFGYQIVIYLFLAGVAAGSALFASWMLLRTDPEAFSVGKQSCLVYRGDWSWRDLLDRRSGESDGILSYPDGS